MEFRIDRLSHPPTLSLKREGESGCTKLVGRSRVHEHLVQTGLFMCVCVCFLPIHSGHQWTHQPGSHRRKVTQDF